MSTLTVPSPTRAPLPDALQVPAQKLMLLPLQEQTQQALTYCFLMCDYLLLNTQYDLSEKARQAGLLDRQLLEKFKAQVKELSPGEVLEMDLAECTLFVTVFDLAGKCFVSNVMDDMRSYFTAVFGLTGSGFAQFRRYFLQLAASLIAPVRAHLQQVPSFRQAMARLDALEFSTE